MTAGKLKAFVCLSPRLSDNFRTDDRIVIIIDVLRATSCWVTALSNGAASIHPVSTIEECKSLKESGYTGAAERQGHQVSGFDIGNSPLEYTTERVNGKKIAVTTTNGSQNVNAFKKSKEMVIGSFLNFSALAVYLEKSEKEIVLACSGWEGGISLEDIIFAGALLERLDRSYLPADDASVLALDLWKTSQPDFKKWLLRSSHVQRLLMLGLEKDIDYCLTFDRFDIVPRLEGDEIVVP